MDGVDVMRIAGGKIQEVCLLEVRPPALAQPHSGFPRKRLSVGQQPMRASRVLRGGAAYAGAKSGTGRHSENLDMSIETLLVIVLVVLLIGGGGFYGRGRWY